MAENLHLVTFSIGAELFGVPISAVQEIVRVPAITQIPHSPDFIEGIINLRGRVITVVDMRRRLGHKPAAGNEREKKSRILVVEADRKLIGVIVDEVHEVLKLAGDRIEPAPPMAANLTNQYINGVGKLEDNLLILIDIKKLLSNDELAVLDEMPSVSQTIAA
jgi:purine-binding chemotaxis protein CheW